MDLAVCDSHGLIGYATGRTCKLGKKARRHFERADSGAAAIYIPTIALVEIAEASHRGVVGLENGFTIWCDKLLRRHLILSLWI